MIVLKGEMKREERDSYGDGKSPPKEKVELLKETARVQRTDRANNLNLHQREASESKRQIAVISIFTVIYFGYINNKMKSFKTDLNFVIDPIPADGAPHGSRC